MSWNTPTTYDRHFSLSIKATPIISDLLAPLRRIQEYVRDRVLAACERAAVEDLAQVDDDASHGDTIYAIDRIGERALVELFETEIAVIAPVVLIGEGLPDDKIVLPAGTAESEAIWRVGSFRERVMSLRRSMKRSFAARWARSRSARRIVLKTSMHRAAGSSTS